MSNNKIMSNNKQIKCETCKHCIDKCDAQEVETHTGKIYYCPMHIVFYDKIISSPLGYTRYYRNNVQVDERNGEWKPVYGHCDRVHLIDFVKVFLLIILVFIVALILGLIIHCLK